MTTCERNALVNESGPIEVVRFAIRSLGKREGRVRWPGICETYFTTCPSAPKFARTCTQGLLYDVPRHTSQCIFRVHADPAAPCTTPGIVLSLINRYLPGVDVLVEFVVDNLLGLVVGQLWTILFLSQSRRQRAGMELEKSVMDLLRITGKIRQSFALK